MKEPELEPVRCPQRPFALSVTNDLILKEEAAPTRTDRGYDYRIRINK